MAIVLVYMVPCDSATQLLLCHVEALRLVPQCLGSSLPRYMTTCLPQLQASVRGGAAGHRSPLLNGTPTPAPSPASRSLSSLCPHRLPSSPRPFGTPSTVTSRRLAFLKVRMSHRASSSFGVQPRTVPRG
uniref:Uncharacterized protein n=1 Tax=Myotis myotis TaxID=51298 RepID=A0A7J7ZXY3_MYOMY|nr:hypothetical protein mMyoMyo1_009642 [Myotis myotis]